EPGEWMPGGRRSVAVYDYTDERGKLLFQVLRSADKHFSQRRPDPAAKSGWAWNLKDVRRVPYRLPKILAAARGKVAGRVVWLDDFSPAPRDCRSPRTVSDTSDNPVSEEKGPLTSQSDETDTSDRDIRDEKLLAGVRDGAWLSGQQFPPLRYAVAELVPEGLTL